MKAILINTEKKIVEAVETTGGLEDIYKLLKCKTIEHIRLDYTDGMYVDEEGLINNNNLGEFHIYGRLIIGNALIVSHTSEGETIPPRIKLDRVRKLVTFITEK